MNKEIASFQNGVDIVGQPVYVTILEGNETKGKGLKLKNYTQKGFVERVRNVIHKITVGFILAVGVVSCDEPETYIEDIQIFQDLVSDSRFYGLWKPDSDDSYFFIKREHLTYHTQNGNYTESYSTQNAHTVVSGNTLTLYSSGRTYVISLISSSVIEFEGVYYTKAY